MRSIEIPAARLIREISTDIEPCRRFILINERDIPKRRLKIGPARLPVRAMTPNPRLARATFNAMSGAEFPNANSVIAR